MSPTGGARRVTRPDASTRPARVITQYGSGYDYDRTPLDPASLTFAQAKAARGTALAKARRAFERALRLDPDGAETHIRLAHVDILDGKDDAAAARLAPIVARTDLDARLTYLARLFLGDVRARAGKTDEARALLEQAIAVVPSGQSAHIAVARVVRSSGDHDQAGALLHRMMNAPVKPDDPMIGYRFGQYWVPDPLIATLRAEALRK
jgi:Tfp pilus assembly protein PilF